MFYYVVFGLKNTPSGMFYINIKNRPAGAMFYIQY